MSPDTRAALRGLAVTAVVMVAWNYLGWPVLAERGERATLAPLLGAATALAAIPAIRTRRTAIALCVAAVVAASGSLLFHRFLARLVSSPLRPVEAAWTAAFYMGALTYVLGAYKVARAASSRALGLGPVTGRALALPLALLCALVVLPTKVQVHRPKIVGGRDPSGVGGPSEAVTLTTADGVSLSARYVPPPPRVSDAGGASGSTSDAGDSGPALLTGTARAVPSPDGRVPGVVVAHGIMAEKSFYYDGYGRMLRDMGYAVLFFDFRGHGESDGHVETFGLREVMDVRAAVDHLRARPEVDPSRIAIVGHSMGAAISVIAAAEIPEIRGVVADAGYDDIRAVGGYRFRFGGLFPDAVGNAIASAGLLLGVAEAGIDLHGRQPIDVVGRIAPRPVLFVHGTSDRATLPEYSRRLHAAAGAAASLLELEGVGHSRGGRGFPRALLEGPVGALLARAFAIPAAFPSR